MHTSIDKATVAKHAPASMTEDKTASFGGSAFHIADHRPEAVAQRKLRELAANSPQVQEAQTIQRMANNCSQGTDEVIQLMAIRGGGNLHGTVTYKTADNQGDDSAYQMSAKGIKLKANKHALAGKNSVSVDPPGWSDLQTLGLTKGKPHYKRMHLLNGELGGHGNRTENIAPGSADLNTAHHTEIEGDLQTYVLNGGEIRTYDVFAFYRGTPLSRLSNNDKTTYQKTLAGLHCQYELDNGTSVAKFISEGPKTAKAWP